MEHTNFFRLLGSLQVEGDWNITIKAGTQNRMLVSVLFNSDKIGDNARKLIPPMILKGTTEELDSGFFNAVENPVKKTASLFVNMEEYAKAQETARLASKGEQDKKKDGGNKKYEAAMKKVDELEAAGKVREAYGQLPKVAEFPDYEEQINEKKEELREKFDQTGLFANTD